MANLQDTPVKVRAGGTSNHVFFTIVAMFPLLIVAVAGCVSNASQADEVAATLQSYQPGKTTFEDFKRDARLEVAGLPATLVSYKGSSEVSRLYVTMRTSPWRIYKRGDYLTVNDWRVGHLWQFAVGNEHQVISVLTFNGQGQLVGILPVTVADLARSSDPVMAPAK